MSDGRVGTLSEDLVELEMGDESFCVRRWISHFGSEDLITIEIYL